MLVLLEPQAIREQTARQARAAQQERLVRLVLKELQVIQERMVLPVLVARLALKVMQAP